MFTALFRGPARFVDLAAAGNSQSMRRHVFRNGRTCGDIRAVPDAHRRDEGCIAADKNFVPDRRRILMEAIIIAGNRARADVALRSDFRVAQVREVHGFGAFTDGAIFKFNEITDTRAGLQVIVRAKEGKRTNDDVVVEAALRYHAVWLDGDVVAEDCVRQYATRSNGAVRADFGLAQQLNAGFDDGVFARGHVGIDQHGLRQLDGDAVIHQRVALPLPEHAVDFGEISTCIATKHFARIGGHVRHHALAPGIQRGNGISEIQLAVLVSGLYLRQPGPDIFGAEALNA